MPSFSGVWTLPAQMQAYAAQLWPQGPGAPTSVSATAGDTSATVTFVAPTFTGVPPGITGYLATSSPGGFTATGASSPLTVTGLTNGTPYTITVQATNGVNYGPAGTSGSVTPELPQIATFAKYGGTKNISYVQIMTTGNSAYFGDLSVSRAFPAGCASSTRGVIGGGLAASTSNVVDYITFTTTGNATTFGQLTVAREQLAGCSSSTRGLFAGGALQESPFTTYNTIDYITIATPGNATSFGALTVTRNYVTGASSPTRGVFAGGNYNGTYYTVIDYVTIATTGNATSFGSLTAALRAAAGCSTSTRAVFGGGSTSGSTLKTIQYITIATTGDATFFGDMVQNFDGGTAAAGTTRGVFVLGQGAIGNTNTINYVTIATTGNATDFGDLLSASSAQGNAGCSSANGGTQ